MIGIQYFPYTGEIFRINDLPKNSPNFSILKEISRGWKMIKINDELYDLNLFQEKKRGKEDYILTCLAPTVKKKQLFSFLYENITPSPPRLLFKRHVLISGIYFSIHKV
jgi:hypothetical protein